MEVEVDAGIDKMLAEYESKWRAKDYSESLIRMAKELAVDWTRKLTETFALDPEAAKKIFPMGIRTADHWITTMGEAVKASRG